MKQVRFIYYLLACGLTACGENANKTPTSTKMECQSAVSALDIRDNGKGRDQVRFIDLSSFKPSPTMIGYGPSANPKAEITIIDGTYYLTQPQGDSTHTQSIPSTGQNAVFLITSAPETWMSGGELPEIEGLAALSSAISTQARKLGCNETAVFPFKVKAYARSLTWSITGSPKGMKGDLNNVEVTIIGIYDNTSTPRNAMISGMSIHPHLYIKSENISGHLNAIELAPGASLYVPGQLQQGNENEK